MDSSFTAPYTHGLREHGAHHAELPGGCPQKQSEHAGSAGSRLHRNKRVRWPLASTGGVTDLSGQLCTLAGNWRGPLLRDKQHLPGPVIRRGLGQCILSQGTEFVKEGAISWKNAIKPFKPLPTSSFRCQGSTYYWTLILGLEPHPAA